MTNTNDTVSEEIVVVGSHYGDLADELKDLYDQNKPIGLNEIKDTLGGEQVLLAPAPNDFVPYAVGVFNQKNKRLGYVWMRQAPAIQAWMAMHGLSYILGRITEFDHLSKSLKAETLSPIKLPIADRWQNLDFNWAANLPLVHASLSDPGLTVSVLRLRDELKTASEWTDDMQQLIDNLLKALPIDLSEHRAEECYEIYKLMKNSKSEEVRRQSSLLLKLLIREEADEHLNWWMDEWFPQYIKEVEEAGVVKLFEGANYTLESVESILEDAPENLFNVYKSTPRSFAFRLYFSSLPQILYNRLLTLIAVREIMWSKRREIDNIIDENINYKEPVKLRFFTDPYFRSLGGRESMRDLLENILPTIDENSGRDWVGVYVGYLYFKNKLIYKGGFDLFFHDLEQLLPGILTKIDTNAEGYKRYKIYIDSLSRECKKWFVDHNCLPPLVSIKANLYNLPLEFNRYQHFRGMVLEIERKLMIMKSNR